MVYSTSRCPSCKQVIRRQTNPIKEIAVPFEKCRHCGTTYLNSYKEEWITKSPFSRFFFFLQAGVWARAFIVPVLVLIIPMSVFDLSADDIWVIWPILSLTWLIGGYFIHKKAEKGNIAASLERTKDSNYLNILKQAGYTIYPINNIPSATYTSSQVLSYAHESAVTNNEVFFCRKCGKKLMAGSSYCSYCGTEIITKKK